MLTEKRQVVVAHREMQIHGWFLAVLRRCNAILRALHQMLQRRRTRAIAIFMEQQQTLRQLAIVHVVQQVTNRLLTLFACQLRTESELVFVRQKILNERCLNAVLQILEQVLEHAAGCSGSRDELQDLMSLFQVLLPCLDILLLLGTLRSQNTFFRRCRRYDV